jgi:CRP-like cAMP-binding protein
LSCKSVFDEYSIMKKLPTTLARKLFYHNHRETLKSICLFDHLKSTGVIMYVFNMLSPAQFADGHEIFKENSIPNDVYFVTGGRAEIIKSVTNVESETGTDVIHCAYVTPGQIVGYLGMLNNTVHKHTCMAKGYVSVYYLHIHDLSNVVYDHPFVADRLQIALGKCIHKQNEEFKKKTLEERNKKFAEIMFSESNLLGLEGGGRPIIKVTDEELASSASGKLSPETILTPKLSRFSSGGSKKNTGIPRPGGLRIHPVDQDSDDEEEDYISPVMREFQPDGGVSLVVSEPSSPVKLDALLEGHQEGSEGKTAKSETNGKEKGVGKETDRGGIAEANEKDGEVEALPPRPGKEQKEDIGRIITQFNKEVEPKVESNDEPGEKQNVDRLKEDHKEELDEVQPPSENDLTSKFTTFLLGLMSGSNEIALSEIIRMWSEQGDPSGDKVEMMIEELERKNIVMVDEGMVYLI